MITNKANRGTCRPYLHNCFYCDVEYDVIGKLDEYGEDMLYIAMKQNLTSLMKDLTKVKNKTARKKGSDSMRILEYMSQIPSEAKEKLFELYKIDLEMFDYEYTRYL